ncbi:MAG: prolyl oligopeptidase family serine peptidase [Minicystis sp.]
MLTSLLLAGCSRGSAANPDLLPHNVPGCGAVVDAAPALKLERTTRELEHLRLVGPGGVTASVSCIRKANSGPGTLSTQASWVVGERPGEPPANPVDFTMPAGAPPIDGHPALIIELDPDATGKRSTLMFTERAQSYYWIEYSSPASSWEADARSRSRLIQSFHVTDPDADRGPVRWWHPPLKRDPRTLAQARAAFQTKVKGGRPTRGFDGDPAPSPPRGTFEKVEVQGPQGRLSAYVTPDPKDGKKHPLVIWAHGGFGGIDKWFWEAAPRRNDQSARAFREAGLVLAVGSWRAENDNPGDYELFYGEADDLLALRDHAAKLSYVDADRIYLAGHSSGGTLVLLAAEKSDGFRAAFSLGGSPVFDDPQTYARYGGVPFDPTNHDETLLRSSAPFVRSVRRPTFYFEGSGSSSVGAAQWMADQAAESGVPFQAFVALQADHFSILAPLTELIAAKILADTGPTTNIAFTQDEIDRLRVETK